MVKKNSYKNSNYFYFLQQYSVKLIIKRWKIHADVSGYAIKNSSAKSNKILRSYSFIMHKKVL